MSKSNLKRKAKVKKRIRSAKTKAVQRKIRNKKKY